MVLFFGVIACSHESTNKPGNETPDINANNGANNGANDGDNDGQVDEPPEDIVLKMIFRLGEDNFNEYYKEPIEDKFPHITLELIDFNDSPDELDELITNQVFPDIYLNQHPINRLNMWVERGFAMDLSELIEKHAFDLSRVSPSLVQQHRAMVDGSLYTLPIDSGSALLHYNKDVFDLFGVEYPTDGMTWEEVIALSREVTGERDERHYYGLQLADPSLMLRQLDVPYADPETDEPTFESEEYRKYFVDALNLMDQIFSLPGNVPEDNPGQFVYDWGTRFWEFRDVAMVVASESIGWFTMEEFNFDVVTLPVWTQYDNISEFSAFSLGVSATSEYPDEAFKVIEFMLSEEMQIDRARKAGFGTALSDISISEHYFADLVEERPYIEELNLAAIEKNTSASGRELSSVYDHIAEEAFPQMVRELIEGSKDINTIIREGQENAEQLVQDAIKRN